MVSWKFIWKQSQVRIPLLPISFLVVSSLGFPRDSICSDRTYPVSRRRVALITIDAILRARGMREKEEPTSDQFKMIYHYSNPKKYPLASERASFEEQLDDHATRERCLVTVYN